MEMFYLNFYTRTIYQLYTSNLHCCFIAIYGITIFKSSPKNFNQDINALNTCMTTTKFKHAKKLQNGNVLFKFVYQDHISTIYFPSALLFYCYLWYYSL